MHLTFTGHSIANAVKQLQQRLGQATLGDSPARFSIEIEPVDATVFLAALGDRHLPHMVWGERHGPGQLIAMAGQALPVPNRQDEADQLRAFLGPASLGLRAYASFPFASDASSAERRWLLPRVECNGREITLNVFPSDDKQVVMMQLGDMAACLAASADSDDHSSEADAGALPTIKDTTHWPDRNHWHGKVIEALDLIEGKALEKIVLARRTDLRLSAPVPALDLFQRLKSATPRCFHFYCRFASRETFFGASPERLFRRRGRTFETDVLAGTRPRGRTASEDAALAAELLASDKDGREHEVVRTAILQDLHQLSRQVESGAPAEVLQLASKQHIYSTIRAELASAVGDSTLLSRLHPTPAVGGYPTGNALAEIRRLEPFPREWYAGPIGWIAADGAEFAVGIRSAIARGDVLALFAGAGIVEGSEPGREWDEVENKISDLLMLLQP